MPVKTTSNIIWRFKSTGIRAPRKRGGKPKKYDSKQLALTIFQHISDPLHSNSTLEELQQHVWNQRAHFPGLESPPSVSWIEHLLKSNLFHSKPITLKYASLEPKSRNSPEVLEQRFEYYQWLQNLSVEEAQCLIFLDEHGFNLFTVKHRARSIQGTRSTIETPDVKCQNVTVTLAVSPVFGKISIQIIPFSTTKEIFNYFLQQLHIEWKSKSNIPGNITKLPPIIVLDNLRAHSIDASNLKLFQYHYLPKYSPFLNLAEPCNRLHKQLIRKFQREHLAEMIPYVQNLQWGEKNYSRVELLRKIGHFAWNKIQTQTINNFWGHIVSTYFNLCLKKEIIHA